MPGPKYDDGPTSQSTTIRELEIPASEVTETTSLLPRDDSSQKSWDSLNDFEALPWHRRPSIFWLLGPYAIFTLAFGGIIVPKINLILDLVCKQYFADETLLDPGLAYKPIILGADNPQCNIPGVQRNVASFMLVITFVSGVLSAIVAPRFGHLSDRYGRTKLLALASCGGLVNEMVTVLAAKFPQYIDYRWLILGAIFDGLTGSLTAGNILTQSYTADCTPPSKRAVSIGYMHACLFSGLALGPLLSGYLVKWTGSLLSIFYVALVCHLIFILFVGFVVPESLSKSRQLIAREKWQKEKRLRQANAASWFVAIREWNPLAPLKVLWPTGPGTSSRLRINLVSLAVTDTIVMGAAFSVGAVLILYSEYMFHWGNFETSRFISSLSMVRVFVLMGIFPAVNYIFRERPAARRRRESGGIVVPDKNSGADELDIWILRIALTSDVLGSLGYIFIRSEHLFFASGMVTALGGLGSATVGAAVTKHVPAQRVGQVLGAMGMMQALAKVVGPLMFNSLYAMTVGSFPQAIFALLCGFFCIGFICTLIVRPHVHWDDVDEHHSEPTVAEQVVTTTVDASMVVGEERGAFN